MAKKMNIGFRIDAPMPIDERMQVDTFNSLDLIPVKYDRMTSYVVDEDQEYRYFADVPEWKKVDGGPTEWGSIIGDIQDQTDLINEFAKYALVDHIHPQLPPLPHTHIEDDITNLDKYTKEEVDNFVGLKSPYSTGLIYQGTITHDATTFSIAKGIGIKEEWTSTDPFAPPVLHLVEFGPILNISPAFLATHTVTYIGISYDSATQIASIEQRSEPFTPAERRDIISLGIVQHYDNTTINYVSNRAPQPMAGISQLHDFMESVGALSISGNMYSTNGDLTINRSAGSIFKMSINTISYQKNPNVFTSIADPDMLFQYRTSTEQFAEGQNVDPNMYESGGSLVPVPVDKCTVQYIYLMPDGSTRIQYGQTLYDSLEEGEQNIHKLGVVEPHLKSQGIRRAVMVLKSGATDLDTASEARLYHYNKFSAIEGLIVPMSKQQIIDTLGYVPEDEANKVENLDSPDNITYPTTEAVVNYVDAAADKYLEHIQGTAENVWTIPHNFGKKPSVLVYDGDGNRVVGTVAYPDLNSVTVTFINPVAGIAILN